MKQSSLIFEKRCKGSCGRVLPLSAFPKRYSGSSRDGYRNKCKDCVSVGIKQREERNRAEFLAVHGQIIDKRCRRCESVKPVAEFDHNSEQRDGYATICKDCNRPRNRAYYVAHAEAVKAYQKQYRQEHRAEVTEWQNRWHAEHPEETAGYKRNWKLRNPDHEKQPAIRERRRKRTREWRLEAIEALGGKCACCGLVKPIDFLCIDHIGGWGAEHRRELVGARLEAWLKKHHYPRGNETCPECGETHRGFRVLCYSCNMSIAASPDGTCAHKESIEETARKRIECGTPGANNQKGRRRRWQIRIEAIQAYGGRCHCPDCNETDLRFLCFEHVGRWGSEHRESLGEGANLAEWIRRNGYPNTITTMCFNCNLSAGKTGRTACPHESERLLLAA